MCRDIINNVIHYKECFWIIGGIKSMIQIMLLRLWLAWPGLWFGGSTWRSGWFLPVLPAFIQQNVSHLLWLCLSFNHLHCSWTWIDFRVNRTRDVAEDVNVVFWISISAERFSAQTRRKVPVPVNHCTKRCFCSAPLLRGMDHRTRDTSRRVTVNWTVNLQPWTRLNVHVHLDCTSDMWPSWVSSFLC